MKCIAVEDLRYLFDADIINGRLAWAHVSKYHAEKNGTEAGTPVWDATGKTYWVVSIAKHPYRRSHIIFAIAHGRWPHNQIDHINGISTDDRISNLREATVTQNAWNHKHRTRRIKLPMGVRNLKSGKYEARITCNKTTHYLGSFTTPEEASAVYQAARKEFFGEFA